MAPVADASGRGYRLRGELSLGRLLAGEALVGMREELVTPAGFDGFWNVQVRGIVRRRAA
jgi:hypothetical protein